MERKSKTVLSTAVYAMYMLRGLFPLLLSGNSNC